jgi:hypothetical protein
VNVELTYDELTRWAHEGVNRRISAMEAKRRGAHGFDRQAEAWQIDVEGMLAEAAVAKALNVWFAPVTGKLDTQLGDVLPGVQVRSTRYGYDRTDKGFLLLHKTDNDSDRFVLVCGAYGKYRIAGWIEAGHAKDEKLWKCYRERWAFWVPQSWLKPFDPEEFRAGLD